MITDRTLPPDPTGEIDGMIEDEHIIRGLD